MKSDRDLARKQFAAFMRDWIRRNGRWFPTWREVLDVIEGLGYRRQPGPGGESAEAAFKRVTQDWKRRKRVLHLSWGQIFDVLIKIGYSRSEPQITKISPALAALIAFKRAELILESLPDRVDDKIFDDIDTAVRTAELRLIRELRGPRSLKPGQTTWPVRLGGSAYQVVCDDDGREQIRQPIVVALRPPTAKRGTVLP